MDGVVLWPKVSALEDQINNIKNIGRFLSMWDCSTGMPATNPSQLPYTYKTGDYYRVGTVSSSSPAVNYKPNGATYTGAASTTVESGAVTVGWIYYFDGTNWVAQSSGGSSSDPVVENAKLTGGIGWSASETKTVTWDGDTTDKECLMNMLYRINDDTAYTVAAIIGGSLSIKANDEICTETITEEMIMDDSEEGIIFISMGSTAGVYILLCDVTAGTTTYHHGVYFAKYTSGDTNFQTTEFSSSGNVTHKISNSYLNIIDDLFHSGSNAPLSANQGYELGQQTSIIRTNENVLGAWDAIRGAVVQKDTNYRRYFKMGDMFTVIAAKGNNTHSHCITITDTDETCEYRLYIYNTSSTAMTLSTIINYLYNGNYINYNYYRNCQGDAIVNVAEGTLQYLGSIIGATVIVPASGPQSLILKAQALLLDDTFAYEDITISSDYIITDNVATIGNNKQPARNYYSPQGGSEQETRPLHIDDLYVYGGDGWQIYYKEPVKANPTTTGSETALSAIQIGDTKYSIGGGSHLYQHYVCLEKFIDSTRYCMGFIIYTNSSTKFDFSTIKSTLVNRLDRGSATMVARYNAFGSVKDMNSGSVIIITGVMYNLEFIGYVENSMEIKSYTPDNSWTVRDKVIQIM